jgi:aminoglycoside 3-N-acetyltransferase
VTANHSVALAGARDDSAVTLPYRGEEHDLSGPRCRVLSREEIARDLRSLGVKAGQTLLVHASLRSIGRVEGGAETVVGALRDVLGPDGTLVVPTTTADNSDTSRLYLSRIANFTEPEAKAFRAEMLPFDRGTTPSTGVGLIAEAVRTDPEAVRSDHPQTSFTALGRKAAELMEGHPLTCHLGDQSPLGKMYVQRASVLLLGVGFGACTAFHLAEYWYTLPAPVRTYRCVIANSEGRKWVTFEDVVLNDSDFDKLGIDFDKSEMLDRGQVGNANCRLIPLRQIVDFASHWMRENREHSSKSE